MRFKINRVSIFYLIVITLPFVDGYLKLTAGARWEIYTPLIFFLLLLTPESLKIKEFKYFLFSIVSILMSNTYGLLYISSDLELKIVQQIYSREARMLVETVRFVTCISLFLLTVYFFKRDSVRRNSLRLFVFTAFFLTLYAYYEVLIKSMSLVGHFPLLSARAVERISNIRAWGVFYEPSQFGMYIAVSISIFFVYKRDYGRYARNFLIKYHHIVVILLVSGVILTLSRAAMLILIPVLLIYLFSYKALTSKVFYILSISTIVFLYFYLTDSSRTFQHWYGSHVSNDKVLTDTLEYLFIDFSLLFENWPGLGQGMYLLLIETGSSFFKRIIIENGLLFSLAFFLLFIRNFYWLFRNKDWPMYVLLASLLVLTIKYNSSTHAWYWFVLGFVHSHVNSLVKK
jgi:hypothetical protein